MAADQVVAAARSGADRALIYGCPGSGKTYGGLYISSELKTRANRGPGTIVFSNNDAVKSQWIARAASVGLELREVKHVDRQLVHDELPLMEYGLIMNYAQAIHCERSLKYFVDRHRPIVILDEVHHTATPRGDRDGNSWGTSVMISCANASFKLPMTGTPFRGDDNLPLAFVDYNAERKAVPLVRYTYEQAIRDGVCRPIEFELFDGVIEWIERGQVISAEFSDKLSKRLQAQRRRAAVSAEGEFPVRMLEAAHARLVELRKGSGVDAMAKGMVVAESINQADELAKALSRISGADTIIVHDKIDNSIDKIEKFKTSDDPWIIGIKMLSEGVDIPPLRVGVYATNIIAPLYFHQFCGRFSRVMESRQERSWVFMPADPELEATAIEIEKEKYHALGEEPKLPNRPGTGGSRRSRREIAVESSDSEIIAKAFGGQKVSAERLKHLRAMIDDLRRKDPHFWSKTDTEIVKEMIAYGAMPPEVA
jgi:superfamily II DNA or RNA helicase